MTVNILSFKELMCCMKTKDKVNEENKLMAADGSWAMLDNIGDTIIEDAVTGVASDLLSALPVGNLVVGVFKGLKNANELKKYRNFIRFMQTYKTNTDQEIHKYLEKNPSSEIGEYTLSMLQELSGERQTELFARASALLLNKVISEKEFYEYGYIISKLDPHLYSLVLSLNNYCYFDENGKKDLRLTFEMHKKNTTSITNPNLDLISFGFLDANKVNIGQAGQEELPQQTYTVNLKYKKFYDRIVIGEKCTSPQKRK